VPGDFINFVISLSFSFLNVYTFVLLTCCDCVYMHVAIGDCSSMGSLVIINKNLKYVVYYLTGPY
jgi:hypothetical protein